MNSILLPCQIELCLHINHATSMWSLPVCESYCINLIYSIHEVVLYHSVPCMNMRLCSFTHVYAPSDCWLIWFMLHQFDLYSSVHSHATWYLLSVHLMWMHMWMSLSCYWSAHIYCYDVTPNIVHAVQYAWYGPTDGLVLPDSYIVQVR